MQKVTTLQPTVYRYERSKTWRFDIAVFVFCLLFGLMSLREFISDLSDLRINSWFDLAAAVMLCGLAIVLLAKIVGFEFPGARWSRVRLSLDDDGLTYVQGGLMRTLRFSWSDLSDIECEGPVALRGSLVSIRREATGLMDWLTVDPAVFGTKIKLPDMFDAAPKEIAAKLNEYRDRALPGARATTAG